MAELMNFGKPTPDNFYETKSHMWILLNGKVCKRKARPGKIHAEMWGPKAWDITERGYYNEAHGLVSCHGGFTPALISMLAKKFPTCMYYRGEWE
jgi:hypothetical protein